MKVKLEVLESKCRSGYHKKGDTFIVEDLCPPICHELWQCIYPNVYTLLNGGNLDFGSKKCKMFRFRCPDNGRVLIKGEIYDE
ncbi:TIGR04076 family protein [Clostridiaceae bacterium M8S5]|nr:TIGR04076 family protein [Clostridiaceae bacterium M8S5]